MSTILFILSLIFDVGVSDRILTSIDYSGSWEYKLELAEGEWAGAFILDKTAKGYTGHILNGENFLGEAGTKTTMENLVVKDSKLSFEANMFGYVVKVHGFFENELFNGTAVVEGNWEIPFTAKRSR